MDADLKKISEFEISDELVILKQQCENLQVILPKNQSNIWLKTG